MLTLWEGKVLFVVLLLLTLATPAMASQRCEAHKQEVRREHFAQFGVEFPWWYAVGQLQQESGCRNVVSNDGVGSQGLPQITWSVWKKYLQKQGVESLTSTTSQLRAQALINKDAYGQVPNPKKLWVAYQIYNGGPLVKQEIKRAGVAEWSAARAECRRKVITFSNGQKIDACNINYDYGQKLFEYGSHYSTGPDSALFPYW